VRLVLVALAAALLLVLAPTSAGAWSATLTAIAQRTPSPTHHRQTPTPRPTRAPTLVPTRAPTPRPTPPPPVIATAVPTAWPSATPIPTSTPRPPSRPADTSTPLPTYPTALGEGLAIAASPVLPLFLPAAGDELLGLVGGLGLLALLLGVALGSRGKP
jgi:hypothetical protein